MKNIEKIVYDGILGINDSIYWNIARLSMCILYGIELSEVVRRALNGFASEIMVAASIWSLIIPAMPYLLSFAGGFYINDGT